MVLIVTPASEINKAEKWKWWLWFPRAWCGICEAAASCVFMSLFRVPAQYRHTESLIRTHALMEDSSVQLRREMLNLSTPIIPSSVECSVCWTLHNYPSACDEWWKNWFWQIISINASFFHKVVKSLECNQKTCTNGIIKQGELQCLDWSNSQWETKPVVTDLCFCLFTSERPFVYFKAFFFLYRLDYIGLYDDESSTIRHHQLLYRCVVTCSSVLMTSQLRFLSLKLWPCCGHVDFRAKATLWPFSA